jgi:hypothetical protein
VTKVTEALRASFWHFWHLLTLRCFKNRLSQPREEWLLKDELNKRTSWLDALKSMDVETTGKAKIGEDSTSPFKDEISEFLIQRGTNGAKRVEKGLLSLLSSPHFEVLRKYDPSLKRGGMTT